MFVLIVDDEPLARERLAFLLLRSGRVRKLLRAESCEQALGLLGRNTVDAIFLDISMPIRTGISMASEENLPPVVFVTAHEQHAAKAFEVDAVDYVLKPLSLTRVLAALDRIQVRSASRCTDARVPARITATCGKLRLTVDAAAIARIFHAHGRTAFLHKGREYATKEPIATLAEKLAPLNFLRIHRNEVVNLRRIARVSYCKGDTTVLFHDGQTAVASRRGARELRKLLSF